MTQYAAYAVLSVCSNWCMLYSVNAVLGVYAVLGVCCTGCMVYLVLTLKHGMERERAMT